MDMIDLEQETVMLHEKQRLDHHQLLLEQQVPVLILGVIHGRWVVQLSSIKSNFLPGYHGALTSAEHLVQLGN